MAELILEVMLPDGTLEESSMHEFGKEAKHVSSSKLRMRDKRCMCQFFQRKGLQHETAMGEKACVK